MKHRSIALNALAALALSLACSSPATAQADRHLPLDAAWTRYRLDRTDLYMQYVVLDRAARKGLATEYARKIDELGQNSGVFFRRNRRQVDLFDLFSGSLAVQESLQLQELRRSRAGGERHTASSVDIDSLTGPTLRGHPWLKMLAGRDPQTSALSKCVPNDQYLVLFQSLSKMLDALQRSELWSTHFMQQASKAARTPQTDVRIKRQLAIRTDALSRPFYDVVVAEIAMTGSDVFLHEGSDIALIFRLKQPKVFRPKMDGYLADALRDSPGGKRSTGVVHGVPFVHVTSPDRSVHVFSAYPRADLHVRCNSRVGLERVLRTIKNPEASLGASDEDRYIRTLMPLGAAEEDGFIYLSDPFIRRLVGPTAKLTERRRMQCRTRLRMIGHASLLHLGDHGRRPRSLQELVDRGYLHDRHWPAADRRCESGGKNRLGSDGVLGSCSHHGRADALVPCCEIPLRMVTAREAGLYRSFLENYNRYWRQFFDPIAVRVKVAKTRYRVETIILPLIDNSIYTGIAEMLGGEAVELDTLPVPKRNIFSMVLKLDKEKAYGEWLSSAVESVREFGPQIADEAVRKFVEEGIGDRLGFHVYDASQMFAFNLPEFFGEAFSSFRPGRGSLDVEWLLLLSSFTAPVYTSMDVRDAEVVDAFLEKLDGLMSVRTRSAKQGSWFVEDFYVVPGVDGKAPVRCFTLGMGPIKLRFFWARIGDGFYVASKKFILDDLHAAHAAGVKPPKGGSSHAMTKVRAQNWREVLPDYRLGWAENHRHACVRNLGALSSLAESLRAADANRPVGIEALHGCADRIYGHRFFCPDGGGYAERNGAVRCTIHGTATAPRQALVPAPRGPAGRVLSRFSGLTAELSFLEDGLRAVLIVEHGKGR